MSARTEKAHTALADALAAYDEDRSDRHHAAFLLRVAEAQAAIAQAEALERIADAFTGDGAHVRAFASPMVPWVRVTTGRDGDGQ